MFMTTITRRLVFPSIFYCLLVLGLGQHPALAAPCVPDANGVISGTCYYDNTEAPGFTDITNDGTITVSKGIAFYNSGALSSLTNNDTITNASPGNGYGILNSGASASIDTITNNGTISSPNNGGTGIGNDTGGHIGTIVNSSTGTISGYQYGIWNLVGTIGTIDNSGTITSSINGIDNSSTLGTITNRATTGVISGTNYAIVNASGGTITTLDNAGKISSPGAGIWNKNSITTLTNETTGTIEGTGTTSAAIYNDGGTITTLDNAGKISGGAYVIWNKSGTITTLNNTGTISGGTYGVNNYGSNSRIVTLNNSGTISSGTGVYNGSTGSSIGALNNTGTISGTNYAINNSATLGTITNSGTISGNIKSTSNLTINGGDSSYGTLSGGTITINSGAGTLFMNSGYSWLTDNITGSASNSGASLKVSQAVTISGSYTQTGGGLVVTASGSGYGSLTVSGAVSISNSSITISGTGLSAGETFTIVSSSTSGSYSGNTVTVSGTSGLRSVLSTNGNDLVVTLLSCTTCSGGTSYQSTGRMLDNNAGRMGATLDAISGAGTISSGMQSILDKLDGTASTARAEAIKELGPSQITQPFLMSNAASQVVTRTVEMHQQTTMAYDPAIGKAAGSDAKTTAAWGEILAGGSVRNTSADADGYRVHAFGLAAGIDHMLSDELMGGVALSWMRAFSNGIEGSTTGSTLDSYQITPYGTYRIGQFFVDGQASVAYNRFHQTRDISFLGSSATADFGGEQYLLRAQTGYDLPIDHDTAVTPLVGLSWSRTVTDGYTEHGAGVANLAVLRQGANSLSHDLGAKIGWNLETDIGRVKPEVRLEWVHDYTQSGITTNGSLDGVTFATSTPRLASDGAQIGLSATLEGSDSLSLRASYIGEMRPDYQSHTGTLKAIWAF
jgi:uncharacterized protein with beta-barrel porin domain